MRRTTGYKIECELTFISIKHPKLVYGRQYFLGSIRVASLDVYETEMHVYIPEHYKTYVVHSITEAEQFIIEKLSYASPLPQTGKVKVR